MTDRFTPRQLGIVLLTAAVQFVNVLDFVIVMPLGPFFSVIGVPQSDMGYVGGAYTAAACVAGLVSSLFLDRFDRRKALAVAMVGLVIGTASAGFATGMTSLLLARCLAGMFGGPATAIALSIVSDTVAPNQRGRALGLVMGAFAVATVVGVPVGLIAAEAFSWRAPFFAVAAVGLVVALGAIWFLPPFTAHLEGPKPEHPTTTASLLSRPIVQVSYLMTAVVMMGSFVLIPNLSNYLHLNHGVPLADLKYLYFIGGFGSFAATQLAGWLVDRYGSFPVAVVGSLFIITIVFTVFYRDQPLSIPVSVVFIAFMVSMAFRNVPYNALTTKVPGPAERARFQSLQSAVQHGASACAAMLSPQLLHVVARTPEATDVAGREPFRLEGMPHVALVSLSLTTLLPLLVWWVERQVKRAAHR